MFLPKDTSSTEASEDSKTKMTSFKEFDDEDRSDNGGGTMSDLNESEDDYDAMLMGGRKTLEKGKTGSKSKRGNIRKDPKAVITQD